MKTDKKETDKKIKELFDNWCAQCDAAGELDFYGMQALVCREMVEAGEMLLRRRVRTGADDEPTHA